MIKDIKELNFPEYATLSQATCTLQDMAEYTITTQVKIDGQIMPDFSYDWEIEFKGAKYIMPLRQPQAAKENTSFDSTIDLTFQHWAQYQLKRWMFFTVQPVDTGTAVADKYIASVSLDLKGFCDLLAQVLDYYYDDAITIDLNPDWKYSAEPANIEISHSYIWDVLIQLYELYAVRWQIESAGDTEHYVIKVGYPTTELSHIFEYGFKGGLLKVERQVQDENIRNMLLGRGGDKNLPYRYFKDVDKDNDSFPADPDWIPELANIYFSELHGATYRSYIQGWKAKHYNGTTTKEQAYAPWAWEKGYTDTKFDPVEYVKDDSSIRRYGPLFGGLDNNEDIYPTIQGVDPDDDPDIGRVDEVVDVEQILSDDVEAATESDAVLSNVEECRIDVLNVPHGEYKKYSKRFTNGFSVPSGKYANLDVTITVLGVSSNGTNLEPPLQLAEVNDVIVNVYKPDGSGKRSASGIPEGDWIYEVVVEVHNMTTNRMLNVTVGDATPKLTSATPDEQWSNTFDIWIKNIWGSTKSPTESPEQYKERVWRPILGDREGNEAKVVFSTGMLATSEDYEFTIVKDGVHYDPSKTIDLKDAEGNIVGSAPSEWRLTLAKSDADLESLGLYVPSSERQGKPGDHFFFIGIDMPHQYVLWAEERLDNYKKDELDKVKDIKPTWVVGLDKVRIGNEGKAGALIDQLAVGNSLRLADKRFIINEQDTESGYETLYLQSITYTYNEPTSDSPALLPDVEVVLSEEYATSANPVATLSGEVNAIRRQLGSISNVEQIVRAVGDKLYLRKDGIPDRSMSPTEYASLLTSMGFRAGIIGGNGWGFFKDEKGNWFLETDRINVRQEMRINSLVINQTTLQGGTYLESAAQMEVTRVDKTQDGYVCYFDQKRGSVANLFHVDDVAYCSRFTSDNKPLKFYKRRVMAVAEDSITLTDGYSPVILDDGTVDTGVNGSGIPEAGDAIGHYGNYTDPSRRFVKVRDVIDGGYERYIEDLDSVNSSGTEYFFVGRQAGQSPRWFVGNTAGHFIDWQNGKLVIKGEISVDSTIGGEPIGDDYIKKAIKESTRISGGLILASMLQLGFTDDTGNYVTTAGVNGIREENATGNGLAFWAGGKLSPNGMPYDAADDRQNGAVFAVRHDGTAYAARNTIRFKPDTIELGDNLILDSKNLTLIDEKGKEFMRIGLSPIGIDAEKASEPERFFDFSQLVDIYHYFNNANGPVAATAMGTQFPLITKSLGWIDAGGSITSLSFEMAYTRMLLAGEAAKEDSGTVQLNLWYMGLGDSEPTIADRIPLKWSAQQISESLYTYTASHNLTSPYTAYQSGTFGFTIEGVFPQATTTPDDWPYRLTSAATPLSLTSTVKYTLPKFMASGSDGWGVVWQSATFVVKENIATMRVGNRGIKIDANGIYINRDDGKGYVDL